MFRRSAPGPRRRSTRYARRLLAPAREFFQYPETAEPAYGIWLTGLEHRVLDNDLAASSALTHGVVFIDAFNAARSIISGNRITDSFANKVSEGIRVNGWSPGGDLHSEDVLVTGNQISGVQKGVSFLFHIPGKYRDNITSAVAEPYFGGTDAGNNN